MTAIQLTRQQPRTPQNHSLVQVKSLADMEGERATKIEAEKAQNAPIITGIAAKLKSNWEVARFSRNLIEERIIDSLRRRRGEYDPKKLAMIRASGGSEIYMMLTGIKCRAAEAWIFDVLFPAGDKPFSVDPTKLPDIDPDTEASIAEFVVAEAQQWQMEMQQVLPPEALEERMEQLRDTLQARMEEKAKEVADRMEDKIEDQTQEGGWEDALKEVIKDVITYPAGILKGPIVRKRKSLKWEQDEQGNYIPVTGKEFRLEWKRVAPFDLYPSPSSTSLTDGYFFERHRLRRADLVAMKGVPGYNDNAINLVLEAYCRGGLRDWLFRDQERAFLEGRPNEWLHQGDTIDALEYWGSASGKDLLEWGMSSDKIKDQFEEYEVSAWLIGSYVIRVVLNDDPLGDRPYDKSSFEEIPGAFWGFGVPEIMKDVQDVCNAAARSMVNNMGIASGPMVEVHTDRVPVGEDFTSLHPWKIFQTLSDPHGTNNPAVRFHNPANYSADLLKVYDHFSNLADEYTGIPKYAYGQSGSSGGAAGTASGLSMLMSSAARGIKQVIGNLDRPIEGSIRRTYIFNMIHDKDQSIKGDLKPIAKGSRSLVAKEQQMIRRNEFLAQTNNPTDMSIIGVEGRAEMLRESVKSLDMVVDKIVPDRSTLVGQLKQAAMQQMEASRTIDQAGNPVSGQDNAVF